MDRVIFYSLVDELEIFFKRIKESETFPEDEYIKTFSKINPLYKGFPITTSQLRMIRTRATPKHTDYENIKQLGAPPTHKSPLQRCNFNQQPILYAANSLDTSFLEVNFENDPCATSVVFKLRENSQLNLITIGELDHFRRYNRPMIEANGLTESINELNCSLNEYDLLATQYVDSYIAEIFRSEGTSVIYELTSRISNCLFATGHVDGIAYPSVKHRGGINYAILPKSFDEKFMAQECITTTPVKTIGYGLFEYKVHERSSSVDESGNINWSRDPRFNARMTIPLTAEWSVSGASSN